MRYEQLHDFISHRMRMSHVYQPVMIAALLKAGRAVDRRSIARSLLEYDLSQVEYYERTVDQMVGRVLRNHGVVTKQKSMYSLEDFDFLSAEEVEQLLKLCERKVTDFLEKRPAIWDHRKKSGKYLPGSIRYQVLSAAKGKCELCGIAKEERALEVDHIVPKARGGPDSVDNYQALCYKCNANKRDTDDTDFRGLKSIYLERKSDCPFCRPDKRRILAENDLALLLLDTFPVCDGHMLVIPRRHTDSYFDLGRPEVNACNRFLREGREILRQKFSDVKACNIGVNDGTAAGQTIDHCHIHLIPRRSGDVPNPTGGVRGVIPEMADYTKRK